MEYYLPIQSVYFFWLNFKSKLINYQEIKKQIQNSVSYILNSKTCYSLEIIQPFNINGKIAYIRQCHISHLQHTPLGTSHTYLSVCWLFRTVCNVIFGIAISCLVTFFLILHMVWNFNNDFRFLKSQDLQDATLGF